MEACPRLTADPPSAPLAPPETGLLGGGGGLHGGRGRQEERGGRGEKGRVRTWEQHHYMVMTVTT